VLYEMCGIKLALSVLYVVGVVECRSLCYMIGVVKTVPR
jgi:uncharacterized MAPEG superfamily protein